MTLPSKGSRHITIDEKTYRWYIRKKPTHFQGDYASNWFMAVELEQNPACLLHVDFVISRPDNWLRPHQTAVTPAIVKDVVLNALQAGWEPTIKTKAFHLRYPLKKSCLIDSDY